MKISQFSRKYKVSNDTIRYYMELKLIIPEKKGGHYHFDEKCEEQMKELLLLKEMGFSLQQIQEIIYYQKIGILTNFQRNNYYRNIFKKKLAEVIKEIDLLKESREKLSNKIKELDTEKREEISYIGIPINTLSLFACPQCQRELLLEAEKVTSNQIITGSLNCSCGTTLKIEDGILYTNDPDEKFEKVNEEFFEDYLKTTDAVYLNNISYGLEWMQREISKSDIKEKVILEPGSGFGFLLRQIYKDLPASSIYICIDNRPGINILLKQILETIKSDTTIIFITADLPELPLKQDSVDILIDFTGTSNYSFSKSGFLLELLDKYLKRNIKLFATYLVFQKFSSKNVIPTEFRGYYRLEYIKKKISQLGYQLVNEQISNLVMDNAPGKYEQFAKTGDIVNGYQISAERWG